MFVYGGRREGYREGGTEGLCEGKEGRREGEGGRRTDISYKCLNNIKKMLV